MKKTCKRVLAVALSLVMVFSVISVGAVAIACFAMANTVTIGAGRFGPYIKHGSAYVTLPKSHDPMTITLEEATALIEEKQKSEAQRVIQKFDEEPELQVLNGRFGPYIAYKGSNYKLPKTVTPAELTLAECLDIVSKQQESGKAPAKRKYTKKK